MFLDHKEIIKLRIYDGGIKSDFPSFSFIEPGTNKKVEFSFHEDNLVYDDKYVLIKRIGTKNKKEEILNAIRVPKVILEVALENGWE